MSELSLEKFSSEARSAVTKSQSLADKRNHKEVEPIHFLAVALGLTELAKLLESSDVDHKEMQALTESQLQTLPKETKEHSYLSGAMIEFLRRAEVAAGNQSVTMEHLLHALTEEKKGASMRILQNFGIGPGGLKKPAAAPESKPDDSSDPYLKNLTDLAKSNRLDPVIGRNVEVRRLLQILGRRSKNHPILVGETGVGKRSIVNALAMKIASGNVSSKFTSVKVIHLDAGRLVSGVKARGDVEERMKKALSSIKAEDTILFIHGIDSLFNQSAALSGSGDLVSSLLARENLRLITSTTTEGFRKLTEKDANLTRQFTPINIDPSTDAETIEILRGIAVKYETYHNVRVGDPAICSAVKLAKRYLQKRALPDSAIDLIDEASSRKKFEVDGLSAKSDVTLSRYSSLKNQLIGLIGDDDVASLKTKSAIEAEIEELGPSVEEILYTLRANRTSRNRKHCTLTEEDIAAVLEDWTGIPLSSMLEGEGEKLSKMEDILTGRVVGQEEAVKAVAKSVRRARLGLRDLGKPIGSFLFLGPSGVGKTELAKALAKFLFDDDKAMIRMDMSEYMEKHMAQRLIGAPPGYAQADEGGLLTEAVSKKPYSVLLFDEIEKAHPDVFNLLLQVLDDGRLTDGLGKTVDFTNTVVIMTSNIGSGRILELPSEQFESPEGVAAIKDELQVKLREHLRPELLNRIDETVVFRPLTKVMLQQIANIQINLLEKMLAPKEIKLAINDEAKSFLVDIGYEPGYGARPLKRAILKHVQDALAERIMSGVCKDGSTVNITVKSGALNFQENEPTT
eukprot:gnl/Spiro4/21506_TR10535_c0_g1_i1.p1 gnl/Spiro4/21506_TR10535_c0_g1~~gnl/Spiro4/21506_TR10535_c0_g1_i1.p1  ORF type:complete len:796 (+),score=84.15 gnl/Spiro4/21506_TR10535_c0_g1_i1:4218-6605(+)